MTRSNDENANQPGEIAQFKCDFCGALFENEDALRKHEETCTGDEIEPGL